LFYVLSKREQFAMEKIKSKKGDFVFHLAYDKPRIMANYSHFIFTIYVLPMKKLVAQKFSMQLILFFYI